MSRFRLRGLPSSGERHRHRRAADTTWRFDGLRLHRITREAIRDLHAKIEVLDAIVSLLDGVSTDVQPGDEHDRIRATTTMVKAALREIVSTAIDAAVAVGQVRFVGQLRGIEIEDAPEE